MVVLRVHSRCWVSASTARPSAGPSSKGACHRMGTASFAITTTPQVGRQIQIHNVHLQEIEMRYYRLPTWLKACQIGGGVPSVDDAMELGSDGPNGYDSALCAAFARCDKDKSLFEHMAITPFGKHAYNDTIFVKQQDYVAV